MSDLTLVWRSAGRDENSGDWILSSAALARASTTVVRQSTAVPKTSKVRALRSRNLSAGEDMVTIGRLVGISVSKTLFTIEVGIIAAFGGFYLFGSSNNKRGELLIPSLSAGLECCELPLSNYTGTIL